MTTGPVAPARLAASQSEPVLDPQALGAKAEQLGQALRKDVDAAGTYGSVVVDEQAALGQLETQALNQLLAKVKAGSGSAAPGAALARFAVPSPDAKIRPAQGLLAQAYALAFVLVIFGIGAFDPRTGDIPEHSMSTAVDSGSGTSVNVTLSFGSSGGVVSLKLGLDGTSSMTPPTGGVVTTTGTSALAFSINPCPDAGGGVAGAVDVSDSEVTSSPGHMSIGWHITGHTDFATQVDDQAEIATTKTTGKWDEKVTRTATQAHGVGDRPSTAATWRLHGDGAVPACPWTPSTARSPRVRRTTA
ncbi:MAG: hypothetical protein U0838_02565 [Chloroflexota bacterium]